MKKTVLLAAFACCAIVMNAQNPKGTFSIKPMAGINVVGLSGGSNSDMFKSKVGFTAGVEAEYGVSDWLGVSLGALYSQQGAKIDKFELQLDAVTKNTGKLKSHYLNLPLLANVYIPGVRGLAVKAGVQLGFCLKSEMEVTTEIHPGFSSMVTEFNSRQKIGMWETGVCKSVDFGIPVGLSYEYKNIVLDARYYIGLTKVGKEYYQTMSDGHINPPAITSSRNSDFSFTLGYRFHL
jgi:hypothetical protein